MSGNEPPGGESGSEYAGIVTRGCAFALDVLIVQGLITVVGAVVALIVSAFAEVSVDLGGVQLALAAVGWALVFDVYMIAFWALAGQTPGMRVLGIEVTTTEGARMVPRRGIVRIAGMVLAAIPLFLGYLPILTSEKRQGLHDKLAGSVVRYVDGQ